MFDLKEKIFFTIFWGSTFCLIPCIVIAVLYKYEMLLFIDAGVLFVCLFIGLIDMFIDIWKN